MPVNRIALLIHSLQGGGAERLMAQLANRWSGLGHEVHLVTWAAVDTDQYSVDSSVERHGLDLMKPSGGLLPAAYANFSRVGQLKKQLREVSPELVLSFCDQMNIVTLEATRSMDIPVWIAEHSNPERQKLSRIWEAWRSRSYPRCTGCVALTRSIADYMSRWIEPSKLKVIPPAIDIRSEEDSVSSGIDSRKVFLSVGRLSQEKGVDVLLQSWKIVIREHPHWELWIAGEGSERAHLESIARELPNVKFLGWVKRPQTVVKQADVFVLPSRYEGFPVALLEAMAVGVPSVVTDCSSAVEELNRHGPCLEVAQPEDPSALAAAMEKLGTETQYAARLATVAQGVSEDYQWGKVGQLWDELLPSSSKTG